MNDKTHTSPKAAPKQRKTPVPKAINAAYQAAFMERQREAGLVKFQRMVTKDEAAMLASALAEKRNETGEKQ